MRTYLFSALLALFVGLVFQGCSEEPPYTAKRAKPGKTSMVSPPSHQRSFSKSIVLGESHTTIRTS
jgi:hypothetical protein